ncbi:restriction endonuclease [Heyndrickxia camelliae]|uniref:Restriction endonuclease n=1 Tax=Heyndrickxia camelliae TaxID=1707093 RepID=A0A2N3LH08_9BACI|nr:restriction endonuclease [Heyndrickxia camelliae]PKR83886.1 restriction endonuclease [Heyndrickxia camelliae]
MSVTNNEQSILKLANNLVNNISESELSIYDEITVGDPNYWIPSRELELLLNEKLCGIDLGSYPNRTRSKIVKQLVCKAIGYPCPSSFKKTKPRFPGQNFDVATQKSNNFQPVNESISPSRRYVLIRPSKDNIIQKVRVVPGTMLAALDTTGKLTVKHQATLHINQNTATELVSQEDTNVLKPLVSSTVSIPSIVSPIDYPSRDCIMSIQTIYEKLKTVVGKSFNDAGIDQERNRGAQLHNLVCQSLGYSSYKDDGRFPDLTHQLLEVKLQTSPTIDLGLDVPSSIEKLELPQIDGVNIRVCDVRYAIFYGSIEDGKVTITNFYLTTGEDFFSRFPQTQGNVQNTKLQIWLKKDFFD